MLPLQAGTHTLPLLVRLVVLGGIALLTELASSSCSVSLKSIDPAVVEQAHTIDSWYKYLPEKAPYFCLQTRCDLVWKDPQIRHGYWKALHPESPHRVMMEAKGDTFILHRGYVWDGNSIGHTHPSDLIPSLRHDALYHALREGAPLNRRELDQAYLRDERRSFWGCTRYLRYLIIRCFGRIYTNQTNHGTLLITPTPTA